MMFINCQLKTRTWARGETTDYEYDALNQLTNVAYSATNSIARSYDSLGRTDGIALDANYAVDYANDSVGRFSAVTSSVDSVSSVVDYSYVQGSDILSGWSSNDGTSFSRTYELHRDLIATVSNVYDSTTVSSFSYENDALGRRTKRVDSSSVTNEFGYNARSEVIEALMGTENYSYRYDPIGNRFAYTNSTTALSYDSNQLNQYTNIANGVTLTPTYDDDGNMLSYDDWNCEWNGENRLMLASNVSTVVTNKYDYMGRRISKSVDGVETEFLYDGWNLVKETTGTNVTQYVWGLDLSQSLQGAGGVGGLLCVIENGEEYYPCFDANGNITEYVDSTGTVVAHYEYSAFGKITAHGQKGSVL